MLKPFRGPGWVTTISISDPGVNTEQRNLNRTRNIVGEALNVYFEHKSL